MKGLSNQMVDVLTFVEQVWWEEDGIVPTNERIKEETGVSLKTIEGYWKDGDFRAFLSARGVTFRNEMDSDRKSLTMEQLMVANMLLNVMDKRSLREKLKTIPTVTPAQVSAWMRQPAFQAHLRKRGEALFKDVDSSAYLGLVKAIDAGDLAAIKLAFEMKGLYTPRQINDVNVHAVLSRVIEIIQVHVRDPAILTAIAADIELVLDGGSPQAPSGTQEIDLKL